jgi:hypothetical protein
VPGLMTQGGSMAKAMLDVLSDIHIHHTHSVGSSSMYAWSCTLCSLKKPPGS